MRSGRDLFGAAMLLVLGGCAVGPNYHTPVQELPPRYAAGTAAAAAVTPVTSAVDMSGWWHALQDPELDSLVERAISGNPDLLVALDRLQAARELEAVVVGNVLPVVEASGGAAHGTGSDLGRGRASQALVSADNTSGLTHINVLGGFDALWQVDVFGKYRREIEATRADTQASLAARNGVLVAVVADVARAYVDLRGLQVRAGVVSAAIAALRESQRIVTIRYQRGITNELDVTLATRELASFEAQAAPLDAQIRAAQYTIATLLGLYPEQLTQELTPAALVPGVPGLIDPGLPLDLLRRRPDVEEAERSLAAAHARIGVATANLFPELALSAAVGYQQQNQGTLPTIGKHIWSAGPATAWPLLDFGALDAQVEIADLRTRALLVTYRQTIQAAVREVDSHLDAYAADQVGLQKLETALLASQRAVTLASERYERGLTDYLNVVDAEREEYEIEEQYAGAQVAVAEEFVALYRSLGGGWENYQALPPVHRPQPAVVAMFERVLQHGPLQ